jgi:hypothetical protein
LIWGVAALSLNRVTKGPYFQPPASALDWLKHWDAHWYLDVAANGYRYDPTQMSSVNFLPLYPLLTRAVAFVVQRADVAGYLVSNVACFVAAALLWRLALDVNGRTRAADFAALFFLFGPVSVFFATIYSEATFVCLVSGTLLAARRERWWLAGLLGAGAALTRSVGILLVVPLAMEYLSRRRPGEWRGLLWAGLPVAGTTAYMLFLALRFGDAQAYSNSQRFGGHTFSFFWDLFRTHHFVTLPSFYQIWFAVTVGGALALLLTGVLLRQPLSFTLFALAICLLHFSVKSVECMPRFMSAVVPFYSTAGAVAARWPTVGRGLLAMSATVGSISVTLFVNGYWFT